MLYAGDESGGNTKMQEEETQSKQTAILFIEIIAVVAILCVLFAIAIPHVGQMIYQSKIEARNAELHDIQTAVTEMLYDSNSGTLEPIGPVDDLKQVKTRDPQPLVLADYLLSGAGGIKSGCSYLFTADGTVVQMMP
jgi:Tfp pilus assembly protein PilE